MLYSATNWPIAVTNSFNLLRFWFPHMQKGSNALNQGLANSSNGPNPATDCFDK